MGKKEEGRHKRDARNAGNQAEDSRKTERKTVLREMPLQRNTEKHHGLVLCNPLMQS